MGVLSKMQRVVLRLRSTVSSATRLNLSSSTRHRTFQQHPSRHFNISQSYAWQKPSGRVNRGVIQSPKARATGLSTLLTPRIKGNTRFLSQSSWPSPARRPNSTSRNVQISRDGYTHFSGGSGNPLGGTSTSTRYFVGLSAAGIGIYLYSNLDYAPFTGRRRILGISRSQEMEMGDQAFQMLLQQFDGQILHPSLPASKRVKRVVSKIATTVQKIDPSLSKDFKWQVAVADVDEPNALCVPGGRMLITTGLLRILPTDDDLAVVLAHEIAHALNRHGAESMHLQRMLMPIIFIANQVFDMRWFPSMLLTFFFSLPYGRILEYEADEVGLTLCVEACYDPRVAPDVFRRLAALQNEQSGTFMADKIAPFLSTHPQSAERANRLNSTLPSKLERYNDRCIAHSSFEQFWQGDGYR